MQGTLPLEGLTMPSTVGPMYYEHYPGTVGFTGIKINSPGGTASYLGSALWVKIGSEPP
ncbi:MAG: hypothetical protein MUO73_02645 [Thermoplasmata archaeon]|nr:hypothetical protein [Thermoplasmata archaeon]